MGSNDGRDFYLCGFKQEENTVKREKKEKIVEQLESDLPRARSIVMTNPMGIDVNTINGLRSKFRSEDVHYQVVKNTLAQIAVEDTELEELGEHFKGPTALAYSFDDAVAPAKIIKEFAEEHEKFSIKGGFLAGEIKDKESILELAEMPTKDELRSKLLNAMQAVPTQFVRVLQAGQQDFLNVLNARKADIEE